MTNASDASSTGPATGGHDRGEVTSFDGTRLAWRSWGPADAPLVVLVHGLGLSTESWGQVPQLVAEAHRVVAYDLRGHARSGGDDAGDYSLTAHARDLDAVLRDVVPDGQAALVVGHSLGGGIVVARAHEHGVGRLAGAVLVGSSGSGVTVPGLPADGMPGWVQDRLRSAWLRVLRSTALVGRRVRPVRSVSDRLVRRAVFTSDAPRDAVTQVREDFLGTRQEALAATTLASVSHDGIRMAPALRLPTLVLHGRQDQEVTEDELQELLSALPDSELVDVPGEAHMLPLTDPGTVVDNVARWARHVGLDRDRRSPT